MTLLVCPICGKKASRRKFDPCSLDPNIYVKVVLGLGRVKEFRTNGSHGILQSDTAKEIKKRLLQLASILIKNGLMSKLEVERSLGVKSSQSRKMTPLSPLIEEKVESINELKEELNAQNESKEELLESVRQSIQSIKEQVGYEYETEFDDPLEELKNIIERLNDEYSVMKAMVEINE